MYNFLRRAWTILPEAVIYKSNFYKHISPVPEVLRSALDVLTESHGRNSL